MGHLACYLENVEPKMRMIADYIAARLSITSEKGVTAIEYGLIAALIAVAIIAAVTLIGQKLANTFGNIANRLPSN